MNQVAANLRRLRTSRSMTQTDLAARIGKSPRTISNWENGLRDPGSDNIRRIAEVLDVSPAEIIGHHSLPSDRFFEFIVRDSDMAPEIKSGDVLTVEAGAQILDGDYVIVSRPGVEDACRRIYAFEGMYSLIAVNPNVRPLTLRRRDITIRGKVTEIRRAF
jgi:transcriptional regulator with XRE-family HTH domain